MFIAVETGDLVHSTNMSQMHYALAIQHLKDELASQKATKQTDYEIFRGDAYQVLYPNPSEALRLSMMLKLRMLHALDGQPIEITQAIAYGTQSISENKISENMGEVFIASGRLLDTIKRRGMAIQFAHQQSAVDVIQLFLQHQLNGLTQKQAQVLYHYLKEDFPEQQMIADTLGITRQNVAAHLKRGGAELLKQSIEFFAASCKEIIQ